MYALTISQPFAKLITLQEKFLENRSWNIRSRGLLAIHAGSGNQYLTKRELIAYDVMAVTALAEIVACIYKPDLIQQFRERGDFVVEGSLYLASQILENKHCEGPYCGVLTNIRPLLQPVRVPGKQGLWKVSSELQVKIEESLGNADNTKI